MDGREGRRSKFSPSGKVYLHGKFANATLNGRTKFQLKCNKYGTGDVKCINNAQPGDWFVGSKYSLLKQDKLLITGCDNKVVFVITLQNLFWSVAGLCDSDYSGVTNTTLQALRT